MESGLIGINLITGLMGDYVSPAAQAMVERFGINLSVVDVGWPVSSAIAFATTIVPWVFVTCFVLNIIMLATNTTKTLNIDIWNYWHFILTGSLVQTATGSLILGIIASGLTFIIVYEICRLLCAKSAGIFRTSKCINAAYRNRQLGAVMYPAG